MRKLMIGILIGMAIAAPSAMALRIAKPIEFTEWNTNSFSRLNQTLLEMWNLLNGRYQMNVTTSDPDGNISGNKGELILWDSVADNLCINMGAKVWKCVTIS